MKLPATSVIASVCLRFALSASFLSAVADRFGLWGEAGSGAVAWGNFSNFVEYTQSLLWFLPHVAAFAMAWIATGMELLLAVALIFGFRTRHAAAWSGGLLLAFALSMTFASGPEGALSYSVWTASAAAFLLASEPCERQQSCGD